MKKYKNGKDWYRNCYLQSPHWIRFRNQELAERRWCEVCAKNRASQLHHKYYVRNGKSILGFERPKDTVAICPVCHWRITQRDRYLKRPVTKFYRFPKWLFW